MFGKNIKADGPGSIAAGRDIRTNITTPGAGADQFNELFHAADAYFKNEVSSSGKILRLSKEIDYSSKALFCSLIQIGIPFDAAIHIPFHIIPSLSDLIEQSPPEKQKISTSDIRVAVVKRIGMLAYSGPHTEEEVSMWCAAYIRRYGNPNNQFIKVLDNDKEKELNYEYVRTTLLPHVLSRIIGLPKFSNPSDIFSEAFSRASINLMCSEIVRTINALNVYTIRYKTVIQLLQDLILEPPHPWLVNPKTIEKVSTYNFERAIHHYQTIKRDGTRTNSALFNQSAREFFMHLCAAILSKYGAFLGVGARYGLYELRRFLVIRKKNPTLWSYCQISKIETDLQGIGVTTEHFLNILERIKFLIESSDTGSKFTGIIDASDAVFGITLKLFPEFELLEISSSESHASP